MITKEQCTPGTPVWYSPHLGSSVRYRGVIKGEPRPMGEDWVIYLEHMDEGYQKERGRSAVPAAALFALELAEGGERSFYDWEIAAHHAEIAALRQELAEVKDALSSYGATREEFANHILQLGHNDDCLFCGFKDKAATEVLGPDKPPIKSYHGEDLIGDPEGDGRHEPEATTISVDEKALSGEAALEAWHHKQHKGPPATLSPDLPQAYVPGLGTVRPCRDCGCLVAGGPTRCRPCATRADDLFHGRTPHRGQVGQ